MPTTTTLDGPHGPLRVRVYEPPTGGGAADLGFVWAHGGAFIGGDLDMPEADWVASELAAAGIVVVSVDYRLAPLPSTWAQELGQPPHAGATWPVPQDELRAAVVWAASAGLGPTSWALGGASAGSSIGATTALGLRGEAFAPTALVLVYPTVHLDLPAPSAELAALLEADGPQVMTPEWVRRMNLNHVGVVTAAVGVVTAAEGGVTAAGASVAFAGGQDPAGLPRTLILNSEIDPLRASGEAYAAELAAAGVPVTALVEPGTHHGHLNEPDNPGARRSVDAIAGWLLGG